ncbi:MAG: citrate synthase [Pseudomonadales bacterium]|nr:citrate synthase [Pseudomonadales bacterium]MBO6595011.1 citrate synthase [Pseudomonadales bacterium]MBO6658675.1 citrate synthase [Pseudomonadales bacterium]MBO6701516.1 citrate synthase [Pseudomonadales bacterium]MBO6821430.1 citrate synthase [Pseudomonadales bacterium]
MAQKVEIVIDGKTVEMPVLEAAEGLNVIDVRGLIKEGMFTFDPGFLSTASCDSRVTYIDGDNGILLYRGYPIEQLAENSSHLEVCYLLLNGELPTQAQLDAFIGDINERMPLDDHFKHIFDGFTENSHPMSMVCAAIAGLASLFHEQLDISDAGYRKEAALQLIAKIPTISAMAYKKSIGEDFVEPDPSLNYAENFLHMCFGKRGEAPNISPTLSKALDKIFILHADHEQNASTSTVRMAGSTECNPFAAIAAGTAALWGPSHGGANEAVLDMLLEIGDVSKIEEYVEKAKDKDDPFKLMGFGHRVYKNFDPRATVMQSSAHAVLEEQGASNDPLLEVAQNLEKIAREQDYFIDRKLYPNIDFYSGITLKAMGIPIPMFTVLFTLGRMPGWITHWTEMVANPFKIARPRQLYLGEHKRDYTNIENR